MPIRGWRWLGNGLFPVLFALFMTLAVAPLWYVLYSGSGSGPATSNPPWPGALGLLALTAYFITTMVGVERRALYLTTLIGGWLVGVMTWVALEPGYSLTDPTGSITLFPVLRTLVLAIWSLVAWWVGVRYATHRSFLSPGAVRMATVWGWIVLCGGVIIAALMGPTAGRAVTTSVVVVPLAMVAWVALMTLGELHRRGFQLGQREGSVSPLRHWTGTVGVAVVATAVITVATVLLVPSVSSGTGVGVVGQWLGSILRGIYRVVWPFVVFIGSLILSFFNDPGSVTNVNFGTEEAPSLESGSPGPVRDDPDTLVWILVVAVMVLLVGLVLVWARRRVATMRVDDIEVRRSNVFTVDLVADQMSTVLRRRRSRRHRTSDVDLSQTPSDVRQVWAHLEARAAQRGVTRQAHDTVRDYAEDLTERWPVVGGAIRELSGLYECSIYGDETGHDESALRAWSTIQPVLTGDQTPGV